ncbi:MAG: aldo/keto reductase [Saprospiraceae bacterium]|jgi:predicted oxidoreductase|nr:aldo/keto reductase [Saprospiraceae bacterium]MBK6666748.1 aldo/keto reductase [Saprospiraceae bacterium]MBK7697343.1 aldo/keto reductase [Saprospiraceae bacterium]MBK8828568.1 aldo/keto reductase [Saprospiraceae bacterium]MBK9582202.1 aldo/keto reductase [Saprospiraceae bacterium]
MSNFSKVIAGVIRWGSWGSKLSSSKMASMINSCVEHGVTTFDHADIYGNYTTEREFGDALILSGVPRDQVQLITKCGIIKPCAEKPGFQISHYNTSKRHILESVDQSLENLNTEYIDVLMINRPSPLMNYAEIGEAFHMLKESGKVREFGVVNFSPDQIRALSRFYPISSHQAEVSFTHLGPLMDGTIDTCMAHDMVPMSWSPLGGGSIYTNTKAGKKLEAKLQKHADKYGWTLSEMALLFLMHHPAGILPVVNYAKVDKIKETVDLLDVVLTNEQWFEILITVQGYEMP